MVNSISTDMAEGLLALAGLLGLGALIVCLVLGFRTKGFAHLLVLVPLSLIAAVTSARVWQWDELIFMGAWMGLVLLCGVVAALVAKRTNAENLTGLLVGGLAICLLPILMHLFNRMGTGGQLVRERGYWLVWALPVGLLAIGCSFAIIRLLRWGAALMPAWPPPPEADACGDEQRQILQLLRDGKIAAEEAEALMGAVGPGARLAADRRPMEAGVAASFAGALIVVVGFVLPWAFIRLEAPFGMVAVTGHQAGYHMGLLGWGILMLGMLPAVLACITALDAHLRQGLLRGLFSAIGTALTLTLCLKQPANIGLWVCLVGFLLQLTTALRQAGLVGRDAQVSGQVGF